MTLSEIWDSIFQMCSPGPNLHTSLHSIRMKTLRNWKKNGTWARAWFLWVSFTTLITMLYVDMSVQTDCCCESLITCWAPTHISLPTYSGVYLGVKPRWRRASQVASEKGGGRDGDGGVVSERAIEHPGSRRHMVRWVWVVEPDSNTLGWAVCLNRQMGDWDWIQVANGGKGISHITTPVGRRWVGGGGDRQGGVNTWSQQPSRFWLFFLVTSHSGTEVETGSSN